MHRVVTKAMVTQNGIRKREIDEGPWQPSEALANNWAQYLRSTGRYDSVTVQSNGQESLTSELGQDAVDDDLFLEAGH
jgi:septal ring-binding cell division protein DamX